MKLYFNNLVPNLILFVSLLIVIDCAPKTVPKTTANNATHCESNIIDKCMLEMVIVGDYNVRFPKNLEEMNNRCKRTKELQKCIKDYSSKCLTNLASQTISVLVYGITKGNRVFCSNKKRREDFIDIGKCINPDWKFVSDNINNLTRYYHGIGEYKDPKLRIPMLCW